MKYSSLPSARRSFRLRDSGAASELRALMTSYGMSLLEASTYRLVHRMGMSLFDILPPSADGAVLLSGIRALRDARAKVRAASIPHNVAREARGVGIEAQA